MNKILKIIFPFYNSNKHNFLYQKWWFRLLTVAYIIGIIIGFGIISSKINYSYWGWCYDLAVINYSGQNLTERLDECGKFLEQYRWESLSSSILFTLILHYAIQFIFFKIIINFIALGNKK